MENSNSVYDTLKGILGDKPEEKIGSVLSSLTSGTGGDDSENTSAPPARVDPQKVENLMKLRNILDELENVGDDNRSRLLISLKPYMRTNRQKSIDSAIKLLNLTKLTDMFK